MSTTPTTLANYRGTIPFPERLLATRHSDPKTGTVIDPAWRKAYQTVNLLAQSPVLIPGTHADRLKVNASQVVPGSVFAESDRGLQYIAQNGKWTYYAGIWQLMEQNVPVFSADGSGNSLTASDAGVLVSITDYAHILQWAASPNAPGGYGFVWGPGDPRSGFIAQFVSGPDDPTGWQVCDGSSGIPQLQADGSLISVTVPNIDAQHFFRQ